jgi:tetratricopeptide (TPR) repeat protein
VEHAVSHKVATIEAAISVFEEILQLRPIGHERRAEAVVDLGDTLFLFCYHHEVNDAQRARCLDLLREALLLHPPGHSARDQALHNLARALQFVGYQQQACSLDNLIEAIEMNREALQLRPVGHPERSKSLNNLAYGLMRSFEHCGDLDLLAEAITMQRDVVSLQPPGHPLRDTALSNLANALESSFQHQGGAETLAEAISTSREALHLRPVGHPLRWIALSNLGNALGSSFASNGFPDMLSESICVQREAVQLGPSTHPEYGVVLNNLAERLIASFRYHRDYSALAEAITLLQQSLGLLAEGNRYLDGLNDLAEALIASYDVHKDSERLNDAIHLHREALKSRPSGHFRRMESLQGLGRLLCRAECRSWTEAVILFREALEICPTGSTHRAEVLSDVSMCSLDPDSPFFNLSQGVAYLSEAYSDNFCHVNRRLRSALTDLPRVEIAYTEAAAVLDSSVLEHHNDLILELYAQVISLLPRAANLGLDHSTRLQAVTGLDVIVRDAAARAVVLGRECQAVEMLEGGRGVFWGQALHLRTTAFDEVPLEDCRELQRLLALLEHSSRRVQRSYQNATQRELDLEKRRLHNEEAEALIVKIRSYAGLDRFLLPPTFNALVGALPDGFVAIVNASKLGQHALLLNRSIGLMASLELQPPPTGFNPTDLRSHLPRDMGSGTLGGVTRAMRKNRGLGDSFMNILAMLWSSIARPIITQLGLQVSRESYVKECIADFVFLFRNQLDALDLGSGGVSLASLASYPSTRRAIIVIQSQCALRTTSRPPMSLH